MDPRALEAQLGVRLDALEDASPAERAEVCRQLIAREARLGDEGLAICERLLPLTNVKDSRELSDLIIRCWPTSDIACRLAAERAEEEEQQVQVAAARGGRAPAEIVEPALAGPGRDACVCFFADSIREIQDIDAQRLAVTDIPSSNRFRVVGGIMSACSVYQGMLDVTIDVRGANATIEAVELAGGRRWSDLNPGGATPNAIQLLVPATQVTALRDRIWPAHRAQLAESIAYGAPTHLHEHDPRLMAYLLAQADDVRQASAT